MTWWLAAACWTCVAITQIAVLSIAFNISRSIFFAALQAVIPHVGALNVIVVFVAAITGDWLLLTASLLQVAWITLIVARLLLSHVRHRPNKEGSSGSAMSILHVNVLYVNPTPNQAARDVIDNDADVLTFSELTTELLDALLAHEHAGRWPHRHVVLGPGADGVGVWSKYPLANAREGRLVTKTALLSQVTTDSGHRFSLVVVHPMPPVNRAKTRDWAPSLRAIGEVVTMSDLPAIVIGDFNTTFWHGPLRDLFARGLRSAHLIHGQFLAGTFPIGRWLRPIVRLDHALVTKGVVVHDVHDFRVSGSDHLGIVVSVSTTPNVMS